MSNHELHTWFTETLIQALTTSHSVYKKILVIYSKPCYEDKHTLISFFVHSPHSTKSLTSIASVVLPKWWHLTIIFDINHGRNAD